MDGLVKIGDYPIHHDNKVHVHKVKRNSCPYCTFVDESGNAKAEGSYMVQNGSCEISITSSGMLKVVVYNIALGLKSDEIITKISCCPKCGRRL